MRRGVAAALLLSAGLVSAAPASATVEINEWVLNAGGHPEQAMTPSSPSLRISLGSLGEPFQLADMQGGAVLQGSFVGGLHPPGEVRNLRFADPMILMWDPEPSAGVYDLYLGTASMLPGDAGTCLLPSTMATSAPDPSAIPPLGQAWFFLVTVRNRLGESGTPGADSQGNTRSIPAACP